MTWSCEYFEHETSICTKIFVETTDPDLFKRYTIDWLKIEKKAQFFSRLFKCIFAKRKLHILGVKKYLVTDVISKNNCKYDVDERQESVLSPFLVNLFVNIEKYFEIEYQLISHANDCNINLNKPTNINVSKSWCRK